MVEHIFTIVLDRLPEPPYNGDLLSDTSFGMEDGHPIAAFDREAPSLGEAIYSAIMDLAAQNLQALRIVDEDLLTLADIARRAGCSREAVRRYSTAQRGPGGFPPPVTLGRPGGSTFYRWTEVAAWLRVNTDLAADVDSYALELAYANQLLQARSLCHAGGADALLGLIREGLVTQGSHR